MVDAGVRADGVVRTDLEWSVLRGIVAFRWLAWAWSVAVLVVTRHDLGRPGVAWGALALAAAVSAGQTVLAVQRSPWAFSVPVVLGELAAGFAVLAADGWAFRISHSQSLGSAWPIAGALLAGVAVGPTAGAVAGAWLGVARWVSDQLAPWRDAAGLTLVSSGVLFALAGVAAGYVMGRLRDAELRIAEARAREAVARTLHDGVLQTLAVVQRRSADAELATLAREQELELRQYLFGARPGHDDLAEALRAVAARVERRDGLRTDVVLVDDDATLPPALVDAFAGAVGEALTNAAKHGGARRATVYVEVDGEVFCSVKDDGAGFDPAQRAEGEGLTRSVRGRLAEVGGRVEVDGNAGHGTEVRLRAPLPR